jgi:hypothetical protein
MPYIFTVHIRYFGREITKFTVIYGVYIGFWPTISMTQAIVQGRQCFAQLARNMLKIVGSAR